MAKKITGSVKLQIAAGKATPAPPVGPALGQAQINIMEFCKQFNARTNAKELEGLIIPVVVTVYSDRSFTSSTTPVKLANGPSVMRTDSFFSNLTLSFGFSRLSATL